MSDNPLYSQNHLNALGADLQVFAKSASPLAKYLGTICVDPGLKLFDPQGLVKAYAMLGGFIMPYDPGGKDQLVADITTALTVKRNASDDAETIFIMGHENCAYAGILYNSLLGTADQYPIRKKFVEALTKDQELHDLLENAVKKAKSRGDDEKLIIRSLTEIMLIESVRNFRTYIVDNEGNTIANYMDGRVNDAPRLNIMPIFAMAAGKAPNDTNLLYFDPNTCSFVTLAQIKPLNTVQNLDEILNFAREKFVARMDLGSYDHIVLTGNPHIHDQNCNHSPRPVASRTASDKRSEGLGAKGTAVKA